MPNVIGIASEARLLIFVERGGFSYFHRCNTLSPALYARHIRIIAVQVDMPFEADIKAIAASVVTPIDCAAMFARCFPR